jgi:hypothetical protein
VPGSAEFLRSYTSSLYIAAQGPVTDQSGKGKEKVVEGGLRHADSVSKEQKRLSNTLDQWIPPPAGWAKLNTDAGFCPNSGAASMGVIVRDMAGKVLISSWRTLDYVASSEEAED